MKSIDQRYRLDRTRSVLALIISILIVGIFAVAVLREIVSLQSRAYNVFEYFTTVSNIIAAYASILTIPYALDGITKYRYSASKYVTQILFCGTICVTVTMLLALCLLWPINGSEAVSGYNFWCHIVIPILVIILFGLVSSEKPLNASDCIFSVIPFILYAIVYAIMVFLIGKKNGGWSDLYGISSLLPVWLAFILGVIIVLIIAFAFRAIHNLLAKRRWNMLVKDIIKRYKPEDGSDLRFMLYEMGELMGAYDKYEVRIPLQLLEILSSHYTDFPLEDMVAVFVKGALNKIKNP